MGVAALAVLGMLFSPAALRWVADQPGPANSAKPEPDSR